MEILHDLKIPSAYGMTIFHKLLVRTKCIMAGKKITNQISQFVYSEFGESQILPELLFRFLCKAMRQ